MRPAAGAELGDTPNAGAEVRDATGRVIGHTRGTRGDAKRSYGH
jgi:hypothetical protein